MPSPQNIRRFVLTGAVTSITIAGTLYGAGLKTEQEVTRTVQQRQEATIGDQIASLQTLREGLTAKKQMVEKQIRDLDARIQEKKEKGLGSVDK